MYEPWYGVYLRPGSDSYYAENQEDQEQLLGEIINGPGTPSI